MTDSATQTRYRVEGMDCASCVAKIDTAVRRMPGVSDVAVSVTAGTMTVHHDGKSDLAAIEKRVTGLGYAVAPLATGAAPAPSHACCDHDHDHDGYDHGAHDHQGHDHDAHDHSDPAGKGAAGLHGHDHGPTDGPWWRSKKGRLTIACGVALAAAYGVGKLFPAIEAYAFTAAMLVGLIPIARRATMAARAGTPFSIEMLMTIAAVGAVVIHASEEAAAVVFLFLIGELLEGVAAGKARASIQSLTKLLPKTALVEENGQTREIPAESVKVGAIILVRPGDRIAADGVIISGESAIDEAPVTGESIRVHKGVDAKVFAGTINGDAALRVRVTAAAADNTIARVVKLVEEAQESKAPTERFIDRFSRYYTPAVVVVAALVAVVPPLAFGGLWSAWVYKGLAILLIGCPCALVISTPAAIAASLSAGARRGLLLKGGAVLETSARSPPSLSTKPARSPRARRRSRRDRVRPGRGGRSEIRGRARSRFKPSAGGRNPRQSGGGEDHPAAYDRCHGFWRQGRRGDSRRQGCFPGVVAGGRGARGAFSPIRRPASRPSTMKARQSRCWRWTARSLEPLRCATSRAPMHSLALRR
jgi:Cd2+/Zn2+-exporting ATPase